MDSNYFQPYKPQKENEDIELMDEVLLNCEEFDQFNLIKLLIYLHTDMKKCQFYVDKIEIMLKSFGYVEVREFHHMKLTPLGREIRNNGGHLKSLEKKKEESERKTEKEKLEVKQLKWFVKTKWLPLIFSGLALIISILALLKGNK